MSELKAPSSEMVNRAIAEVDELRQAGHPIDLIAIEMATEVVRLNGEIERLRAAITEALEDMDRDPDGGGFGYGILYDALKGTTDDHLPPTPNRDLGGDARRRFR